MPIATFDHDPNARLDYSWNWSSWLSTGETIVSYAAVPTTGVTVVSSGEGSGVVTAWVTATVSGSVTCSIVTSDDRRDDRTIAIWVKNR